MLNKIVKKHSSAKTYGKRPPCYENRPKLGRVYPQNVVISMRPD
jgi:hypothetical protein